MTPDVRASEAHPFSFNNHISKTRGVGKQETLLIVFRVAVVRGPVRAGVARDEQRKVPLMTRSCWDGVVSLRKCGRGVTEDAGSSLLLQ